MAPVASLALEHDPAPRGVAYDSATDLVWVACATGELVGLPAAGGPAAHTFAIERDLRDVIVGNGSLSVTKFRSAEVLRITSSGAIARRDALNRPAFSRNGRPKLAAVTIRRS